MVWRIFGRVYSSCNPDPPQNPKSFCPRCPISQRNPNSYGDFKATRASNKRQEWGLEMKENMERLAAIAAMPPLPPDPCPPPSNPPLPPSIPEYPPQPLLPLFENYVSSVFIKKTAN